MNQVKYSFDQITQNKIVKGALIALTGSAAIGLLGFFGALHIDDPTLAMVVAWAVPTLTNLVKEWVSGQNASL